uniref:Kinesin light chain n=1 Tax=Aplanochytrium stocchinoi TaxID=215587 RepID=A0A7S3PNJ8_9STRA
MPLTRAWCIWELYGAAKCDKPIKIALFPNEREVFVNELSEDHDNASMAITHIKPEDAACFDKKDLNMIQHAVQNTVGWTELKRKVTEPLLAWMNNTAFEECRNTVAAFHKEHTLTMRSAGLLNSTAALFMRNGEYDTALSLFRQNYEMITSSTGGENNPFVGLSLMNIASIYDMQEKYDKALEYSGKAYAILVHFFGSEYHPLVVKVIGTMASAYRSKGEYGRALKYLEKEYTINVALNGGENQMAATILVTIAAVHRDRRRYDEALDYCLRAYELFVKVFGGEGHQHVANVLHNIGNIYVEVQQYDKALEHLQKAYQIYKVVFGGDQHPQMNATMQTIRYCEGALHGGMDI